MIYLPLEPDLYFIYFKEAEQFVDDIWICIAFWKCDYDPRWVGHLDGRSVGLSIIIFQNGVKLHFPAHIRALFFIVYNQ